MLNPDDTFSGGPGIKLKETHMVRLDEIPEFLGAGYITSIFDYLLITQDLMQLHDPQVRPPKQAENLGAAELSYLL
jgi:hypothetical protein